MRANKYLILWSLVLLNTCLSCRKSNTRYSSGEVLSFPDSIPLTGYQISVYTPNKVSSLSLSNASTDAKTIASAFTDVNGKFNLEYVFKQNTDYYIAANITRLNGNTTYSDTLPYYRNHDEKELMATNQNVTLFLSPLAVLKLRNKKSNVINDSLFIKVYNSKLKKNQGYIYGNYEFNNKQFDIQNSNIGEKNLDFLIGTVIIESWVYSNHILQTYNIDSILLQHGDKKEYLILW